MPVRYEILHTVKRRMPKKKYNYSSLNWRSIANQFTCTLKQLFPRCLLLIFILYVPIGSYAKFSQALTTEQIIKQAERLFKGTALSVSQQADDNFYQVRLLKKSGQVIVIQVNSLSGQMIEIKTAQ